MNRALTINEFVSGELAGMKTERKGFVFDDACFDEIIHTFGVAYFTAAICKQRGLDPELGFIIGLLHDVGRISQDVLDKTHGMVSAGIAAGILKQNRLFTREEIDAIRHALANHSKKKEPGEPYDEALKDADLFERIFCLEDFGDDDQVKKERLRRVLQDFKLA